MVQSSLSRQQGRPFVVLGTPEQLADAAELVGSGAVRPVIDRTYPLDQGSDAIGHVVEGHAEGTTVITMNGASG